ncbi:MAG: hypothetical protein ACTJG2_02185 [Candidatus Saccharimonadales bacterium]
MKNDSVELTRYIRTLLEKGTSEDVIRQKLIDRDWKPTLIDEAITAARQPADSPSTDDTQPTAPSLSDLPQKYTLFGALSDVCAAVKYNAAAFAGSVVCSYVIAIIGLVLASMLFVGLLYGSLRAVPTFDSVAMGAFGFGQFILGAIAVYALWSALAGALLTATIALSLRDGMKQQKSSLGAVLSTSFARLGRVVLANILFGAITFLPLFAISFLPLLFVLGNQTSGSAIYAIVPILMLASVVWMYFSFVRFALVPYVAVFEPKTPILSTLNRSKQLLANGGQWFIVKGVLLLLLVLIVVGVLTTPDPYANSTLGNIVSFIFAIIIPIFSCGALVAFYHHRTTQK